MQHDHAAAVLVLWTSGKFSTADIADLLHLQEAAVSRLIIAARSIARADAAGQGRAAAND